jgi:chemotaxis protein MotB
MEMPHPQPEQAKEETAEEEVVPTRPSQETTDATDKLYRRLSAELEDEINTDAIEVHKYNDKILLRFQDVIAFDLASDKLRVNFIPILDRVSKTLSGIDGSILVVGHTDDLPITTTRFRSNWDLSSARAASVVHHMLKVAKLPANHIIASGRADTVPLVPNTSPANRAKNRRVEIVVTLGDITRANGNGMHNK